MARPSSGTESALVALAGLLLVGALKWPVLRHLRSSVPEDLGDPLLQTWQLAWGAHALVHQPLHPWDSNTFFPARGSLAFSDSLLGYAPLGVLFGSGAQAAILRYNVIFLLSYALAFVGAYVLARQLGCRAWAAAVAGIAFAYAPWHLAQEGHLQILSSGGIPLSLALLARGHGYPGGPQRPRLILAGWAVAAWQVTLGFGLGLQFGYLLGAVSLVYTVRWLLRGADLPARGVLLADLGGSVLFVVVAVTFALPYLDVEAAHPESHRSIGEVGVYSPPLSGFVTAPADSTLLGPRQEGLRRGLIAPAEQTLLPGFALMALAGIGLAVGTWSWRRRLGLATAAGLALAFGMGTKLAGGGWTYLLLYDYAPGWQGIRTPGRLVVLLTLALALLAATGVDRLARGRSWVAGIALALVLVEGLGTTPTPTVPALPPVLEQANGPVLVLPSDASFDNRAMYWSTAGLYAIANGNSGFVPAELAQLRASMASFPDPATVVLLERLGIPTVVLLPDAARGTIWEGVENRPYAGLGLDRMQIGDAYVYAVTAVGP